MRQINITQIANRIGRIVLTTALAAAFGLLVSFFGEAIWGNAPSGLADLVFGASVLWGIGFVLALVFVLPLLVAKWLLSGRVSSGRYWQGAFVLAILASIGLTGTEATGFEAIASFLKYLAYAVGVLLAIAVVEGVFSQPLSNRINATELSTGVGVTVVLGLVLVAVISGSGLAIGAFTDVGDASDVRQSHVAFQDAYGHLEGDSSGILCTREGDIGEPSMPVTETRSDGLEGWDVDVKIEERHGISSNPMDLDLTLESNEPDHINRIEIRHEDGDLWNAGHPRQSKMTLTAIDSDGYALAGYRLDEAVIDVYTVTDNGEVVRQTADICVSDSE